MSERARLMGKVSALGVAVAITLVAGVASAALHNYNSDSLGDKSDYWPRMLPGGHLVTYESYNNGTFYVFDPANLPGPVLPYANGKTVLLVGTSDKVHRVNFELDETVIYPTTVQFDMIASAGDVTVYAYDSGDNLLDSQVVTSGSGGGWIEFVRFDEDEIAYIEFEGGSGEDWVDNLFFE